MNQHQPKSVPELQLIEPTAPTKTAHEKLMEAYAKLENKLDILIERRKQRRIG